MAHPPRIRAVSYLNTSPLVWGLLHGPQRGTYPLTLSLPSECADALRQGEAEVGLAPVVELARQPDLAIAPGCGIVCRGPVRSILLASKKPLGEIESFAGDVGSRTSVALTQVLLHQRFGIRPTVAAQRPDLDAMLAIADAALLIGDAALRVDPAQKTWHGQPLEIHDMGAMWVETTGLPMVFAVWAIKESAADSDLVATLNASAAYGRERISEVISRETTERGFPEPLVREYLTQHIAHDLGEEEQRGLRRFLSEAAALNLCDAIEPRFLQAPVAAGQH